MQIPSRKGAPNEANPENSEKYEKKSFKIADSRWEDFVRPKMFCEK